MSKNDHEGWGKIADMWSKLLAPWERVEDEDIEHLLWKRKCAVFDAFLERNGGAGQGHRWVFEIATSQGQTLFSKAFSAATFEEASSHSEKLLIQFVLCGAERLAGFKLEQPPNEIRFSQVAQIDGKLFGLSKDGVLYMRTYPSRGGTPSWTPINMNVAGVPQEPY